MKTYLYHIAYSPETSSSIEPGYILLDNLKNQRPDWFEYWPIRNFFLNNEIDPNGYYGFFSPKFRKKTGLGSKDVKVFIENNDNDVEVFLFSPQADINAFFINPYEGGDLVDPGKLKTTEDFLALQGINLNLRTIVMSSRQIVYSNYFVAKPSFWQQWLSLTEKLFLLSEGEKSELKQALNTPTSYPNAQRKVFIMESIASLLLTLQPKIKTKAANLFKFAWSSTPLGSFHKEAIICDALKIAYQVQGFPEYIEIYQEIRNEVFTKAFGNLR